MLRTEDNLEELTSTPQKNIETTTLTPREEKNRSPFQQTDKDRPPHDMEIKD